MAGVVPIAALALATFVARATGGAAPWTPASAIPVMIGAQVITGAVGEELGWRGYLLPRIRLHLGALGAAWTMAVLWGACGICRRSLRQGCLTGPCR
jgi:membrane protease YdiL (CAAX protease family)